MVCKQNCVEDEKHFLMYCQGFTTIRHELCSYISKIDVSYIHLSENERTKYLLRADNKNTSKIVGKYIHLMFKKRKELLNLQTQLQTVLFRPSGPHQCSADAGVEVSGYSHLRRSHTCGIIVPCQSAQTSKLVSYACALATMVHSR